MVIGAVIAFLFILGLFLSMLGSSPKSDPEAECSSDTDSVQELLHSDLLHGAGSSDSLLPVA